MMITDLPTDLLEEIFKRLPTTSMLRLRRTCKQWNSLLKVNQRLLEAAKKPLVLMLRDFRVFPVNINLNVTAPSIEFKSPLNLKDSHSYSRQVDITSVFLCDGLLLCTTKDDRLVIWNPYLGETKWISHKTDYERDTMFALGYQNNKSLRSYEILRCWNCEEPINHVEFEIFEFSSNSWRVLDYVAIDCFIEDSGVSLKGNTYWPAFDEDTSFLLRFDFTTKRSKFLYFPPIKNFGRNNRKFLSVVREEQLVMLRQNFDTLKMDIWITNNIDTYGEENVLTWSKFFTVDLPRRGSYRPSFVSYLIEEEKKLAVCCDITGKMVTIIGEDNNTTITYEESSTDWWFLYSDRNPHSILNYSPSLVQI